MKLRPIKYQEGWLYVDSTRVALIGEQYYYLGIVFKRTQDNVNDFHTKNCYPIVAQSPNLSIHNMPYIEEAEDVDVVANRCFEEMKNLNPKGGLNKAAQSKGGYSEADVRKAIEKAHKLGSKGWEHSEKNVDEIIQSLNQPKEIEIEMQPITDWNNYSIIGKAATHKEKLVSVIYQKDGKTFLKVANSN